MALQPLRLVHPPCAVGFRTLLDFQNLQSLIEAEKSLSCFRDLEATLLHRILQHYPYQASALHTPQRLANASRASAELGGCFCIVAHSTRRDSTKSIVRLTQSIILCVITMPLKEMLGYSPNAHSIMTVRRCWS